MEQEHKQAASKDIKSKATFLLNMYSHAFQVIVTCPIITLLRFKCKNTDALK